MVFKPLAQLLRNKGHDVYTPTLTGLGERAHLFRAGVDLDCHIDDIVALLHYEDLHNAVLVGHSYGGMVITGGGRPRVRSRRPSRLPRRHANPENGQSLVDVAGPVHGGRAFRQPRSSTASRCACFPAPRRSRSTGWSIRETLEWMRARLTPHPWRCFEQPLQLTNEAALQSIPQSHISSTLFMSLRDADGLRREMATAGCGTSTPATT